MRNLHERALVLARTLRSAEAELVELFFYFDQKKSFRELGYRSLFQYSQRGLGISEALTSQLIIVSRSEPLRKAVMNGELTVSKAKSIASVVDKENAGEWLGLAKEKSTRELERLVAKKMGKPIEKKFAFSPESLALLERVQEVLSQKENRAATLNDAVKKAALDYLKKNDPLEKNTLHGKGVSIRRNQGNCQFILPDGKICGERKWLHAHHKIHRASGGTDDPENLTTLCATHHRMTHA